MGIEEDFATVNRTMAELEFRNDALVAWWRHVLCPAAYKLLITNTDTEMSVKIPWSIYVENAAVDPVVRHLQIVRNRRTSLPPRSHGTMILKRRTEEIKRTEEK